MLWLMDRVRKRNIITITGAQIRGKLVIAGYHLLTFNNKYLI